LLKFNSSPGPGGSFDDFGHIFISGPLALDSLTNTVYIISSEAMRLSSDEFETLHLLAAREDVPLSFEVIYNAVWEQCDGMDRRNEARQGIESVMMIINSAGNNFVWIEYNPPYGYVFRTRWGHNRDKWQ